MSFFKSDTSDMIPALKKSYEDTKVEYRRLGKSGLRVSVPILGAMSFGHKDWADWVIEEPEALELLKAAYDRGLNTWDTANVYSNGHSELIIGKALKQFQIPRQKVIILTKCFATVGEEPGVPVGKYADIAETKDYVNQRGLSRGAIFNQVNASLQRLGTDYIDLLQIHRFDDATPVEETMEALNDLVRSGKVRYIGASSMWAYQLAEMQYCAERNGWSKFVSMQNHYSLLYREEEREMNKLCDKMGVGLIPWSPLARGMLARPYSDAPATARAEGEEKSGRNQGKAHQTIGKGDVDKQIIGRVEELAQKKGWKMSHVALAWINRKVASPIVGFSNAKRMDEAIEGRGKELTPDEVKYLEELYEPKSIIGHT